MAFRFQLRSSLTAPELIQVWATTPLFTAVIVAIERQAHSPDTQGYAVVAPTLMAVVSASLLAAGTMITNERTQGTLEQLVAAPVSVSLLIVARLSAVTTLSVAAFAEAYLTVGLVFRTWLTIARPWVLVAALVLTTVATACASALLSPVFVLVTSARTVQNTLLYPLYLVSGVLVPVGAMPRWVASIGQLSFLSWLAGLFRVALGAGTVSVARSVGALVVLSVIALVAQHVLLCRVLNRVRSAGSLSWT
jgi:ABC-2 type transport system permease protein